MLIYILLCILFCSAAASTFIPTTKPVGTPHYRNYFYIGYNYVADPTATGDSPEPLLLAEGQIYVERLTPASGVTRQYPLLIVHGAGMTATNFLNTPDGRMGWTDWFMGQGYEVRPTFNLQFVANFKFQYRTAGLPG